MRRRRSYLVLFLFAALAAASAALLAEETIDYAANARIRKEGRDNSQLMKTLHVLTDVYGPRLTGSPNFKAAADGTVKRMTDWDSSTPTWNRGSSGTRAG